MKPLRLSYPAWLGLLAIAGCAGAGKPAVPTPARSPSETQGTVDCTETTTNTSGSTCPTPQAVLATQPLQEALHDLRRLGLVTAVNAVGRDRLALTLGDEALEKHTPLAYHLEHFYKAFRAAYDLGDSATFELWHRGRQVGSYTFEGLLLR